MTTARPPRGRLIAVDGLGATMTAAKDLVRALGGKDRSGLSAWDSSGIFTELAAAGDEVAAPSSRTLTLLYAADLAFRLRWQIKPALDAGMSVVAAPYIETAIALGVAAGLRKRSLVELFEFAPKPHVCYRAGDREPSRESRRADGYPTFFRQSLRARGQAVEALRERSMAYLDQLEQRGRCDSLTEAALAALRDRRRARR